jgi:hypothetical protein
MRKTSFHLMVCFFAGVIAATLVSAEDEVGNILQEKAITGGIIVHLDCGSGEC